MPTESITLPSSNTPSDGVDVSALAGLKSLYLTRTDYTGRVFVEAADVDTDDAYSVVALLENGEQMEVINVIARYMRVRRQFYNAGPAVALKITAQTGTSDGVVLQVPAADGLEDDSDIPTLTGTKHVKCSGPYTGNVIIEANPGDGTWIPVAIFREGATGVQAVEGHYEEMRVRRLRSTSGQPVVSVWGATGGGGAVSSVSPPLSLSGGNLEISLGHGMNINGNQLNASEFPNNATTLANGGVLPLNQRVCHLLSASAGHQEITLPDPDGYPADWGVRMIMTVKQPGAGDMFLYGPFGPIRELRFTKPGHSAEIRRDNLATGAGPNSYRITNLACEVIMVDDNLNWSNPRVAMSSVVANDESTVVCPGVQVGDILLAVFRAADGSNPAQFLDPDLVAITLNGALNEPGGVAENWNMGGLWGRRLVAIYARPA